MEWKIFALVLGVLGFVGFFGPRAMGMCRFPLVAVTLGLCALLGLQVIDPFERKRKLEAALVGVPTSGTRTNSTEQEIDPRMRREMLLDYRHSDVHGGLMASVMPGGYNAETEDGEALNFAETHEDWRRRKEAEAMAARN